MEQPTNYSARFTHLAINDANVVLGKQAWADVLQRLLNAVMQVQYTIDTVNVIKVDYQEYGNNIVANLAKIGIEVPATMSDFTKDALWRSAYVQAAESIHLAYQWSPCAPNPAFLCSKEPLRKNGRIYLESKLYAECYHCVAVLNGKRGRFLIGVESRNAKDDTSATFVERYLMLHTLVTALLRTDYVKHDAVLRNSTKIVLESCRDWCSSSKGITQVLNIMKEATNLVVENDTMDASLQELLNADELAS